MNKWLINNKNLVTNIAGFAGGTSGAILYAGLQFEVPLPVWLKIALAIITGFAFGFNGFMTGKPLKWPNKEVDSEQG